VFAVARRDGRWSAFAFCVRELSGRAGIRIVGVVDGLEAKHRSRSAAREALTGEQAPANRKSISDLTDAERAAASTVAWERWVAAQVREGTKAAGAAIAEVVREQLDDIAAAIDKRDQKIGKLEVEITKLAAQVARWELKILQAEVDRDRERSKVLDLPALSSARRVN
jgi:hypothetical protein